MQFAMMMPDPKTVTNRIPLQSGQRGYIRRRCPISGFASTNVLKGLGGNENSFGCSRLELAPSGIMKTLSYIRLALLILGKVFPSEFKSQTGDPKQQVPLTASYYHSCR